MSPFGMNWLRDTAERVVRTYVQTVLGVWLALSGHDFNDLWSNDTQLAAVTVAAATLLTSLGASRVASSQDASFLPPSE